MNDWWVIGSGPSLTYVDPWFFNGKNVVAVNSAGERLGLYVSRPRRLLTFTHYHEELLYLADKYEGYEFYAPEGDQGFAGQPTEYRDNITYFPHPETTYEFDVEKASVSDGLLVGSTSLHGAMHLACVKGAENLILVGADCGFIDGQSNQIGYQSGNLVTDDACAWMARWNDHLIDVKHWLIAKYGVRVYSLNPFVNFNLEGHTWTR